jgi:hypothetical protein
MRFLVDDYFLAYTDGKKELELTLAAPVPLNELLSLAQIPAWEPHQMIVNGQPAADDAVQVTDADEVKISPA